MGFLKKKRRKRYYSSAELERARDRLFSGQGISKARLPKMVHEHHVIGEASREFSEEELFDVLLDAAKKGDNQSRYRAGVIYIGKGDKANGLYWLRKAAEVGWPDAVDFLKSLEGGSAGNTAVTVQNSEVQENVSVVRQLPRVQNFQVMEIVGAEGRPLFLLLLKMSDRNHFLPRSQALAYRRHDTEPDIFNTKEEAREAGRSYLTSNRV